MTDRHEVAIIGCGVIGASIAWHLARAGFRDVVVLEKEMGPGLGSSSKANGGFRSQWTTAPNIRFSEFSVRELKTISARNPAMAFRQVGYLFLTGTQLGEAELRRGCEFQKDLGVDVEWVDPTLVKEIAPYVSTDGLRGGTFGSRDGTVDPYQVVTAFASEARELGVEIRTGVEVTSITQQSGQFRIQSTIGPTQCEWLINASGPYARWTGAMLGFDVPVDPVRRNLALTQPVAESQSPGPMCIDFETKLVVRTEGPAFLIAYSDPNDKPSFDTTFDSGFLEQVAERAANRFPFLETMAIDERKCWAGLYPETPDHHAIIGPSLDCPRFIQCVGFGGHGIMHSPAAGQAVCELISVGRCESFDLRPFRLSRFQEGDLMIEAAGL